MSRYEGLNQKLKQAVYERDNYRCRWCGSTNASGYDVHHIRYRRGTSDDVIENLITLCRKHHNYVHDSYRIAKASAQQILRYLISEEGLGKTGLSVERRPVVEAGGNGRMLLWTEEQAACTCKHHAVRHFQGVCMAKECRCGTSPASA